MGERDDCHHRFAPAFVCTADYDGVANGGMCAEFAFDLFGEDLLSASVDAGGTATEKGDHPVSVEPPLVSGEGSETPLDGAEYFGCLFAIAEVSDRGMPAASQQSRLANDCKAVADHHLLVVVGR